MVRLADGSAVTFRLTDQAAHHVGKDIDNQSRMILYYAEDGGEWVAHYFRRATVER